MYGRRQRVLLTFKGRTRGGGMIMRQLQLGQAAAIMSRCGHACESERTLVDRISMLQMELAWSAGWADEIWRLGA